MMRALGVAMKSIRRSPYQALAAIIILFVTFFIGYALLFFLLGSQRVLQYFETRPQVTAFFRQDIKIDKLNEYADQLRTNSYIKQVKVVSQQDALALYKLQTANDPLLQELVTADILPSSLEVSTYKIDDLSKVADNVKNFDGIDEVVYQKSVIDSLRHWSNLLRKLGIGILAVFLSTSLLIIFMITSIRVSGKKAEIRVQRLVGATKWYILRPFVVEGMFYGLVGSTLAWVVLYVALLYATPTIQAFITDVQLLPVPIWVMAAVWAVGTLFGMFLGLAASVASARRLLAL
jgi:cell division transport system permease protein